MGPLVRLIIPCVLLRPDGPTDHIVAQSILPRPRKSVKIGFSHTQKVLFGVTVPPDKLHPPYVHAHSCSILSPKAPHRGERDLERWIVLTEIYSKIAKQFLQIAGPKNIQHSST